MDADTLVQIAQLERQMTALINEAYEKTNRDKRRKAKPGWFYCRSCDGARVREWEKCPNCGKRNGLKREKPRA